MARTERVPDAALEPLAEKCAAHWREIQTSQLDLPVDGSSFISRSAREHRRAS